MNALLTQIDALRHRPNVMVLTTSNITEAIDLAFVDRADIKAYVGPPGLKARYEILRGAVAELKRAGLVAADAPDEHLPGPFSQETATSARALAANAYVVRRPESSATLLAAAALACEGLSGRALRKLPFLAFGAAWLHARGRPADLPGGHARGSGGGVRGPGGATEGEPETGRGGGGAAVFVKVSLPFMQ